MKVVYGKVQHDIDGEIVIDKEAIILTKESDTSDAEEEIRNCLEDENAEITIFDLSKKEDRESMFSEVSLDQPLAVSYSEDGDEEE